MTTDIKELSRKIVYNAQQQNHNITYVYTAGIYHRSLDTNIHRKEQSVLTGW